jgi:ABC-2 type transport system permease protein
VSNILAIAHKEIRAYFASPIAYVVIGLFALLFGVFYYAILDWFVKQGMQMAMGMGGGPQSLNVNERMIRPLFQNALVLLLFFLPMITMRTYAEEKRSGTIELLLTSPITDVEILVGKFLGALSLYSAMLAVTLVYLLVLFAFGTPEWKPIATAYLGLLLFGGCFVSVGMLVSSFTKNQIVAGMMTFVVFLLLWVIDWLASSATGLFGASAGPVVEEVLNYLSITQHFDDFGKGIVDTKHLIFYVSFITFGLFLTARSVDSERWRG